jgi:hypothetical protein
LGPHGTALLHTKPMATEDVGMQPPPPLLLLAAAVAAGSVLGIRLANWPASHDMVSPILGLLEMENEPTEQSSDMTFTIH